MMNPQNSVFVSEAAFQALSPEDQDLVRRAAVDTAVDTGVEYATMMREAFVEERSKIIEEGGQFQDMSDETRSVFADMIEKAIPSMVSEGLIPEGWYERIAEMRDN